MVRRRRRARSERFPQSVAFEPIADDHQAAPSGHLTPGLSKADLHRIGDSLHDHPALEPSHGEDAFDAEDAPRKLAELRLDEVRKTFTIELPFVFERQGFVHVRCRSEANTAQCRQSFAP